MCPACEGSGQVSDLDLTELFDDSKSLNEGALKIPGYGANTWNGGLFAGAGFVDPDKPITQVHQSGATVTSSITSRSGSRSRAST